MKVMLNGSMERLQANELQVGAMYEIEFINKFKFTVKFLGVNDKRYYFVDEVGKQFSIANNTIEYHRFYKID